MGGLAHSTEFLLPWDYIKAQEISQSTDVYRRAHPLTGAVSDRSQLQLAAAIQGLFDLGLEIANTALDGRIALVIRTFIM